MSAAPSGAAFPVLHRPEGPVELPALAGDLNDLWGALAEVAAVWPTDWTLVGGQMVLLHGLEHGRTPPRVSTDLDVVLNVRAVARGTQAFAAALCGLGFELEGVNPDGIGHRFMRGAAVIDVLAPDGLGNRVDLTTVPPARTLQVPGGTQALRRTELLPVRRPGSSDPLHVPRPNLLGAIVGKAYAVPTADDPDTHRRDLAFLLSLVEDPLALGEDCDSTDRRRLKQRGELLDPAHPAWRTIEAAEDGRAALALLSGDGADAPRG